MASADTAAAVWVPTGTADRSVLAYSRAAAVAAASRYTAEAACCPCLGCASRAAGAWLDRAACWLSFD